MPFTPRFQIGEAITNEELWTTFQCKNVGGMRRSHRTNTLVIISHSTMSLYEDRWIDNDLLYFTGMGKTGDQSLSFDQNKTLAESNSNGVDIHLFEVLDESKKRKFVYRGRVCLFSEPFQETQRGEDGRERNAWVFPIKLLSDIRAANGSLSNNDNSSMVNQREVMTSQYVRGGSVAEQTKRRANGICQLCNNPAPFRDNNNEPYLESHHIKWLSRGGQDTIENTVALCPNCHRKMHILDNTSDVELLYIAVGR